MAEEDDDHQRRQRARRSLICWAPFRASRDILRERPQLRGACKPARSFIGPLLRSTYRNQKHTFTLRYAHGA
jgi:hypothetical protein